MACAVGAAVCTTKGTPMQVAGFGVGVLCCTYASGTAAIFDDEQWNESVKKYGGKAKATCNKIKEGVFVCGEWVVEMVDGAWQVVRRAATAERHFIPRKRARLARSIDGFKTRGGRKMGRPSRGRETRERIPFRF
uniref:Uncharacterized protein n=1 Tax=Bionectria ochroleuca TaxID=29856 RepID=A0A8H7TIP0_BIOOC